MDTVYQPLKIKSGPDGDASKDVWISSIELRDQGPIEGDSPREHEINETPRDTEKSPWQDLQGMADRLSSHQVLSAKTTELINHVSTLIPNAASEGLDIKHEDIQHWVHMYIRDNGPSYAESFGQPTWEQDQLKDLMDVLSSRCGLIASDIVDAYKIKIDGGESDLEVLKNGLLYEVTKVLTDATQAQDKDPSAILSAAAQESEDRLGSVASLFAGDVLEVEVDGADLLISNKVENEADSRAVFRLRDQSEIPPELAKLLYEKALTSSLAEPSVRLENQFWYNTLSTYGELEELSNCTFDKDPLIIENASAGLRLTNIELNDTTLKLCGKASLDNVTITNSRVLFKNCQGSTLSNVTIDKESTLKGDLSGSTFAASCKMAGNAIHVDLKGSTWEEGEVALVDRVKGMLVTRGNVDETFLGQLQQKYKKLNQEEVKTVRQENNSRFGEPQIRNALSSVKIKHAPVQKRSLSDTTDFRYTPKEEAGSFKDVCGKINGADATRFVVLPKTKPESGEDLSTLPYYPVSIYDQPHLSITKETDVLQVCDTVSNAYLTLIDDMDIKPTLVPTQPRVSSLGRVDQAPPRPTPPSGGDGGEPSATGGHGGPTTPGFEDETEILSLGVE